MISDRMKKADAKQLSYPPLSQVYPPDRFRHLYSDLPCEMNKLEYQILSTKYRKLLKEFEANKKELDEVKQDYINEMLRNSKI